LRLLNWRRRAIQAQSVKGTIHYPPQKKKNLKDGEGQGVEEGQEEQVYINKRPMVRNKKKHKQRAGLTSKIRPPLSVSRAWDDLAGIMVGR